MGCVPSKKSKTCVDEAQSYNSAQPTPESACARRTCKSARSVHKSAAAQTSSIVRLAHGEPARVREAPIDRQHSPRDVDGLLALAATTGADELVLLPDGRALTGRAMYLEVIDRDPDDDLAYDGLASVLCANEKVDLLDGRKMNNIGLWLEAQRLNPSEPSYYICLSNGIGLGNPIKLSDGRVLSQVELLLEAVRMAPWDGHCYTWLAMYAPEAVTLTDGRVMNRRDLLVEGFRKSPRNYFCMVSLARDLSPDETLVGLDVHQRQLYIDAIDADPTEGLAYAHFAVTLRAGESVQLRDGRTMQREQLWSIAISITRRPAAVFEWLNVALEVDETITVDGQTWSRVDVCLKAIAFEPTATEHYISLAGAMPPNDTVAFPGGQSLTRQQVLLHAAHMEPDYYAAYAELGRLLGSDEVVGLHDGRLMTKHELWKEAARVGDTSFVYRIWADTLSPSEEVTMDDGRILSSDELRAEATRVANFRRGCHAKGETA
jgi:hypothetical protein